VRLFLGWIYIILFASAFFATPALILLILPVMWSTPFLRMLSASYLGSVIISYLLPGVEWPFFRKLGQLWYEIFEFKANLSPSMISTTLDIGDVESLITCMHPHGIIPFQGIIWAAYCDQYLKDDDRFCYGFGATADVVLYLPFLRNIMMWLTAGPCGRDVLYKGLVDGDVSVSPNRKPKHLYILPGGVAEIFTSNIGRNAMLVKNRYGLMKLSVTTGARLVPTYVFGGNDFFYNIANEKSLLAKVSRKFKMGMLLVSDTLLLFYIFISTTVLILRFSHQFFSFVVS
jgi:hypothetical protein